MEDLNASFFQYSFCIQLVYRMISKDKHGVGVLHVRVDSRIPVADSTEVTLEVSHIHGVKPNLLVQRSSGIYGFGVRYTLW